MKALPCYDHLLHCGQMPSQLVSIVFIGFDLNMTSINMILHIPLSQAAGCLLLIGQNRESRVCSAP